MDARYLTATEAAERLGISKATLYAYVSRGLLRSEPGDSPRDRRYAAEDVERLLARKETRRDPGRAVQDALHFGAPILDSAITRIEGGELYYRGENARVLARTASLEAVAGLIWRGELEPIHFALPPASSAALGHLKALFAPLAAIDRFAVALPLEATADETAFDLRTPAVLRTGSRILALLVEVASGRPAEGGIARALAKAWAGRDDRRAEALISAALIVCADHELNLSAFTARCIASGGATPYAVVAGALQALTGFRHGGEALRVEALLDQIGSSRDARPRVAEMLKRGERIPGFGHRLYPEGDPRASLLLELLYEKKHKDPVTFALVRAVADLTGEQPTVDLGLVGITRALKLPKGSSITMFALGRTIGFIGHAIEQYETGQMIRPRARYVGR